MLVSLLHCCLANSRNDERTEYRYGFRHELMCEFLRAITKRQSFSSASASVSTTSRATIISLKELRSCRTLDGSQLMTPAEICRDYCNATGYAIATLDPVTLSPSKKGNPFNPMHLAQLYDPTIFAKVSSAIKRYNDDIAYLQCVYAPLTEHGGADLGRQFMAETHHFPIAQAEKLALAQSLNQHAVDDGSEPIIRIGDFNLFPDDSLRDDIYGELTAGFVDLTKTLSAVDGSAMYGTFYPFPHDKPPRPISEPNQPEGFSKLDYAFLSDNCVATNVTAVVHQIYGRLPVSDHLPLQVSVDIV